MNDAHSRLDGTATQTGTADGSHLADDPRLPGLTVLYHPDLTRIGDRSILDGLAGNRTCRLSRQEPEFVAPGGGGSRNLEDVRLSRTPILLRSKGHEMRIERGESRMAVMLGGREMDQAAEIPRAVLEDGLVLVLGGRVVLLLHFLDPVVETEMPRFGLVGESPAMVRLRREIVQVADLNVPILLLGESGTGKELVARAIHDAGPRQGHPYIAVNMAALPSALAAAELFGAERGAYTGADRRRSGFFEQAQGGTLFLDEVGETPTEVQALLLRALESGEVQAVGGGRITRPNVRVLSATDANLEAAMQDGRFRAPLFHRLSGYVLRLPPLRQRREDFGRLFHFFLRRELESLEALDRLHSRPKPWLPVSVVARLAAWNWPGNVRQLANVVRQLVIANRDADPAVHFEALDALTATLSPAAIPKSPAIPKTAATQASLAPRKRAADVSEGEVVAALRAQRYRPSAAADALGIPRSSIYDLMDKIPGLRKASELTQEDVDGARAEVGPSLEAMAAHLEVSERALRRRLGQLEG